MNNKDSIDDPKHTHKTRIPWRIVELLVVPILVGLFLLFMEYRSGFFQVATALDRSRGNWGYPALLLAFVLVVFAFMGLRTFTIWLRPYHHFREEYAEFGVLTIVFLMPMVVGSFITGIMPWSLIYLLVTGLVGARNSPPISPTEGYLLLAVLTVICWAAILAGYKRWDGGKSTGQYRAEQKGERVSLFHAGMGEIVRVLGRRPPLQAYQETSAIEYVSQLEPATETLAWREVARELLRLSSSTYAFDSDKDWHDRPGCWLGNNIKTGDLVCLIPAHEDIDPRSIGGFVEYAERIASREGKQLNEVIVAVKSESAEPITEWNSRPIRVETESMLLDSLVDLRDYENEIRKRVLINSLPDSEFVISDVYVQSRFVAQGENQLQDDIESYLRKWLEEPGRRQVALLGEYGQGKSTAALMFTYHLLSEARNNRARIPILIELRGRSPRNQTPLGLLGDWAAQYRIEPQALMRLLVAGRLVLIFEGFDEMALVGDAEMRLKHFKTLWDFCYPQAKILLTGRGNFFLDDEEMKAALGISKPTGDRPYCETIRLAPFNGKQIGESLRCYEPSVRNQISSLARQNSRFRELVARPSLLHIVASLWKKENLSEKAGQLNSANVMELFIRNSYRRQGLKHRGRPGFMALTTSEREYFMQGIAASMAAKRLPNQISGTALNAVITELLDSIPDSVSLESPTIRGESRQPLRNRLSGAEYGVDHVQTDARACGLLVDDPASPGSFRFAHKSFMEYLFASVVAEYINKNDPNRARAIFMATSASISDILALPTSIEFLSELVGTDSRRRDDSDFLPGEESYPVADYEFARNLLTRLSGVSVRERLVMRLRLFNSAYLGSLQYLPRKKIIALTLLSPALLLGYLMGLMLGVGLNVFFSLIDRPRFTQVAHPIAQILNSLGPWAVLCLLGIITLVSVLLLIGFLSRKQVATQSPRPGFVFIDGALGLWNYLSKKLSIQDAVLHRVAGTWILPWAKEQPFDYFMSEVFVIPSEPNRRDQQR